MTRLLNVELARLRWRRAIVVLLLACVVIPFILLAGYAWSTRPLAAADIAQAKEIAAEEAARPQLAKNINRCEANPEDYLGPEAAAADCAATMTPTYENFLYRQPFELAAVRSDVGMAAIMILAGLMMLVGTTFAGHDWNTGSMSNQLLFEPRRLRVWAAKGLAVLVTGAALGTAVLALFWGAVALVASSRDLAAGRGVWDDVLETQVRGVLAIALAGLLGYALTMLFRSTVATLSLMFGVAVAGSLLIVGILGAGGTRWLLPTNFLAFVLGGYEYYDESACTTNTDDMYSGGGCMRTLSAVDGGVYLAVILLVAVLLSLWSTQRRDVP